MTELLQIPESACTINCESSLLMLHFFKFLQTESISNLKLIILEDEKTRHIINKIKEPEKDKRIQAQTECRF